MGTETASAIEPARQTVRRLFAAALAAVDPERAVRESLSMRDAAIGVAGSEVAAPGGVHLVAVGKAAVAMTRGALAALNGAIVSGDVITKDGHVNCQLPARFRVHEAGHPIPDQRGVAATREALTTLDQLPPGVAVLALISGGGSALLEAPKDGLTLEDLARTTDLLLRAGAPIDALNAVRAPLSRVKAGGLRASAAEHPWATLILSDVLGNDPRVIASGPTVPGGSDATRALKILDQFGVHDAVSAAVASALEASSQSMDPGIYSRDIVAIVGDNARAVRAAVAEAEAMELATSEIWRAAEGEAAELGKAFVSIVGEVDPAVDLVIGGGEATVTVRGAGRGGRNTEFALAAALELERDGMDDWVVASLATDGQDALTGLAGAIADAGTAQRARARGVDSWIALGANDSAAVFAVAGGAVETGPTGTNVNDLYMAIRVRGARSAKKGGQK